LQGPRWRTITLPVHSHAGGAPAGGTTTVLLPSLY